MSDATSPATGARADLLSAATSPAWASLLPASPPDAAPRPAAVLMLFGVLDDVLAPPDAAVARDLDVLLQKRATTLSTHPGQVSFPGGKAEPEDADVAATALREAEEETGLDPSGVEVLAVLPELPLIASNHRVSPVLGWWRHPSTVAAVDHAETVEVFRMPVARLLDPAHRYTSVRRYGDRVFRAPAFEVDGTVVWGFTAMVLDGLFDAAGWTVPWDRDIERPV
ncbi:8-oxo-dGTP pyrophosphatase MutT (NUDIX family) [Microbacterium resistens]|uniref:8-oxo-dGTP pyrophosphatase MutT (NUDIX family) n=1 Tax=Microbacterium resistens TaxID=156977 RepID=A0ABU1SA63_9MICO|nr:CoA pyrophosphatase [Microbacterium resistens]MDR6866492.1 8-oxo-dGTP pyrophosphatase MutT (NUDIX family) [Microbacterium resistens]